MVGMDIFDAPPLQLLGLVGAATYIMNYTFMTLRIVSTESVTFFLFNLFAASLVLLSLGHAFNAATLMIQVFFVCVSLVGILTRVRRHRADRRASRKSAASLTALPRVAWQK